MNVDENSGPTINFEPRTPATAKPGSTSKPRRPQCRKNFGQAPFSWLKIPQTDAEDGAVGQLVDTSRNVTRFGSIA